MLKLFGYGDKIRKQILDGEQQSIELLDSNDYRTPWDINRPIINLYRELENVYEFLDSLGTHRLTDEGVFTNSLKHQFDIKSNDVKRITLFDKRDHLNITLVHKVYARINPGIAGVYHDDTRQQSMIVVNKPNIRFFERQVAEILGIFYHTEKEGVWVKWNNTSNTFKAKISKKLHPSEAVEDFYFGGDWEDDASLGITSQELISNMYNNDNLNAFFVNALNHNIEDLILEPLFEITTTGTKFWIIENGEVKLSNTNTGFFLGSFDITNLNPVNITSINKNHRRYGENIREDIHGTMQNSYELNTSGGVEYNIARGLKIDFSSGAIIQVNDDGDITINTASGKDLNIGGANLLEIKVGTINTEAVFTHKGNFSINATEIGESVNVNAETRNKTIGTDTENTDTKIDFITTETRTVVNKNDSITNLTETIGTKIKNVTGNDTETITNIKTSNAKSQRINAVDDIILKSPIVEIDASDSGELVEIKANELKRTITTKNDTIATENKTVTNKNDSITTRVATINSNTETVVTETNNITTQNNTIGTETNTITTLNKTVTGNETEQINGNSTETVDNTKTSNAKNQRINGIEDIVLTAPNITLDTGADGTITLIGKNQTIEGDTVRLGDNIIELNKNQTGTPPAGLTSGIEVNRGNQVKARLLFRESDRSWVSGIEGAMFAAATREDVPTVSGIPSWDSVSVSFKTDSKFLHNRTTGTVTVNTNNATTTPPFITNSSSKINNMNVDKVDGVDIDNTGAVQHRIAFWNSNTVIHSRDMVTTTAVRATNSVDTRLPTEKAVQDFTNGRFALDNSFSISNASKGISISYTNGNAVSRTFNVNNIDVDKVDGVDIDNTNAANNRIAFWSGATTIEARNMITTTAVRATNSVDTRLPTEKAVQDFANGRFAQDNSFSISNLTKGISISYTNGDGTSRTFAITNIDVDKVDGVDINSSGAANGRFAMWNSGTSINAPNLTLRTTIRTSGAVDTTVPTEKAVNDYFNNRVRFGTGTFNSKTGRTITHNLGGTPTSVQITASSDPDGFLGEYWVGNMTATTFVVYCSGSTTSATFTWAAFR